MGSAAGLSPKPVPLCPPVMHILKRRACSSCLLKVYCLTRRQVNSRCVCYLLHILWAHRVSKQNTNNQEQIVFYLCNKANRCAGQRQRKLHLCLLKTSPWISAGACPALGLASSPSSSPRKSAGVWLVEGKRWKHRLCLHQSCWSLHPASLHITKSGGCVSKKLGANTPPEQMQTARSWKCASATKPSGLGRSWRQGHKEGLCASYSIRAAPGQALLQTALTHPSCQLRPGSGVESKPTPAPKWWCLFPHGSCAGMWAKGAETTICWSLAFPSHLLRREDEHGKSWSPLNLQPRILNGVLGGSRPRRRDWWHKKTVAKQGAFLGEILPSDRTPSFSPIRESSPAEHLFSCVYTHLSLPLSLICITAHLSQGTPNVQFIPGAARGGTVLALTPGRQVSAAGTAVPPAEWLPDLSPAKSSLM